MARKKSKIAPFVPLPIQMVEGEAYKSLSGNASKALTFFIRIEGKLKWKLGRNYSGSFDFTYSEAQSYGFARRTFSRAIEELVEKGFIEIVIQGGKRGCGFSNSRYSLSSRWMDFGKTIHDWRTGEVRNLFIGKPRYPREPE